MKTKNNANETLQISSELNLTDLIKKQQETQEILRELRSIGYITITILLIIAMFLIGIIIRQIGF